MSSSAPTTTKILAKPSSHNEKKKRFRAYSKKPDEGKEGIPTLKCGKDNNFHKFREALSDASLIKFGNLGRLINDEKYYIPAFVPLILPAGHALSAEEEKMMKKEAVKLYARELARMEADRPKLYVLILQHLSVESREEVRYDMGYDEWSKELDVEKLWKSIVKTHQVRTNK